MNFTDQICCWGIKLFYGSEIRSEIENGRHHVTADATNLDKTVDDIFQTNQWQQDSSTTAKKAAIKDVLKDSLWERKQELLPNLLQSAQTFMIADQIKLPLTLEDSDVLSKKLQQTRLYKAFKPYEISYILRNFSAVRDLLAHDQIITVSGPNDRIRPREDLNDNENETCGKWLQIFHQYAKPLHREQKREAEQKGVKVGSMLELAQTLSRLSNATNPLNPHNETCLTPESADHLSAKLCDRKLNDEFEPYEISYMLQNFSAISAALAQDQLIDISPEGYIRPKAHLNDDQIKRAGKTYQTLHFAAMSIHEESKAIHKGFTKLYSKELGKPAEELDNEIYKILNSGTSPKYSGLSREQIVKAIENKDPEILAKAYQTLEDHYKNPQKPTDPYQRRIL